MIQTAATLPITKKNNLLALAKSDLELATQAYDAACKAYKAEPTWANRSVMQRTYKRMAKLQAEYKQAEKLMTQRKAEKQVGI